MRNLRNTKGFTLIELMIVVVIIGILAAIAIPKFTSVSDGAKQAEALPVLKQVCSLAQAERLKTNIWPAGAITTLPGWEDPAGEYFTFAYNGDGTATANTTTPRLRPQTMDCDTRDITDGAVVAG